MNVDRATVADVAAATDDLDGLGLIATEFSFVGTHPSLYTKAQMADLLLLASDIVRYAVQSPPFGRSRMASS